MAELKNLKLEVGEGIAQVTVSRPKALNALNAETLEELDGVFRKLAGQDDVGVVILTGEGDKAFVAGADITELAELGGNEGRRLAARGQAIFSRIENFAKPVIAAVNGFCLGGGCELAMACHIRIASENARFGQPEVKLGLIPGYGGTQRLPRLVGQGAAMELTLTGDIIDAAEARRIGLVNRVTAPKDLIPECRLLAARILKNAPLAVGLAIRAVNAAGDCPLGEGLELEAALFGLSCASQDMKEGTRAFLEKRAARFEGK